MRIASIAIGCDHAGYPYKDALIEWARAEGHLVQDFGTHSADSVDYPDFVHPVAGAVTGQPDTWGILLCGSANGVAITANKHAGVRAAIAWKPELAELARLHNDANVLCIPARFVSVEEALAMARVFFSTSFEGGRHQRRVDKIAPRVA
jgi:ribose 5-phosphate isomerase B